MKKKIMFTAGVLLLAIGLVSTQAAGEKVASIGENGIKLNTGSLMVNGNDITDSGTTIWDSSTGNVPSGVLDGSALSWTDLGISQSDVSSSDVGLGNVLNKEQLAIDGSNSMSADLSMSNYDISGSTGNAMSIYGVNVINSEPDSSPDAINGGTGLNLYANEDTSQPIKLSANGAVYLTSDNNDGEYDAYLDAGGNWNVDGTKNWIHDLENGSEAVYSSQESPEVRAVYEDSTEVDGTTRVKLPYHFSETVSDTQPKLRATATVQGELAYAAVIEKTDDYIVLDSSKPATVNYRITGIREGYEDKQVVRPKE